MQESSPLAALFQHIRRRPARCNSLHVNQTIAYPPGLGNIPTDILLEILRWVDFRDVLRLGQTTRRFHSIINTRAVWLMLARRCSARRFGLRWGPVGGSLVSTPSFKKLRKWAWKRLMFDELGARDIVLRTRSTLKTTFKVSILVPGGRWLLAVSESGEVNCYDLDMKQPKPKRLLHLKNRKLEQPEYHLTIEVCPDSLELEFILAIVCVYLYGTNCIKCYRIKQHRQYLSTSLKVVEQLASFKTPRSSLCDVTLRNNLIAHTRVTQHSQPILLDLFRWKKCSMDQLMYASPAVLHGTTHIRLLANDRVLCCRAEAISIYDIPPFQQLTVDQINEYSPKWRGDKWTHMCNPITVATQVYSDGVVERVVVGCPSEIVGVAIPLNGETPVLQFSVNISHTPVCVGLSKAFITQNGYFHSLASFSWDDGRCSIWLSSHWWYGIFMYVGKKAVLFDEETGRVVVPTVDLRCQILDFVSS